MRAVLQPRYGDADVLVLGEIERPVPGPREVLIRVRAVSLNFGDAIFDLVGSHALPDRLSVLAPNGVYVSSFGQGGGKLLGPLNKIWATTPAAQAGSVGGAARRGHARLGGRAGKPRRRRLGWHALCDALHPA